MLSVTALVVMASCALSEGFNSVFAYSKGTERLAPLMLIDDVLLKTAKLYVCARRLFFIIIADCSRSSAF
jgi:hypothetical protein